MRTHQKGSILVFGIIIIAVIAIGAYYYHKVSASPDISTQSNDADAKVKKQYAQSLFSSLATGNERQAACAAFSSKVYKINPSDNTILREYFFSPSKNICFGLVETGNNTGNAEIVNLSDNSVLVSCTDSDTDRRVCSDAKNTWDSRNNHQNPTPFPIFYPDVSGRIGTWEALKSIAQ